MTSIQSTKEAPTAAKVAGVVGVAAAAGSLVYAVKHGKVGDVAEFSKAEGLKGKAKFIGEGYKALGSKIVDTAKGAWETVKSKFPKKAAEAAEKTAEVVE